MPKAERALAVVEHQLHLGVPGGLPPGRAAEDDVLHRWPRTAPGDCSPSAQRTASVMLDLPEPLGPTITLTPGPNSSRVRSGKDLKPLSVIDFRYMGCLVLAMARLISPAPSSAIWAASCSASFLLRPIPRPSSTRRPSALTVNVRSWGGPCSSTTA